MALHDEPTDPARRALRRAPISGEVESRGRRSRAADDDDTDPDGPSAADLDRFAGVTMTCRSCGKEVYDDAEVCYHCGGPVVGENKGLERWWLVAVVALLILGFSGWAMVRLL